MAAAAAVAELESALQALLSLKPPGVTKTRISSITSLCVENVKSESVIVQKIYTHFKKTPGTHKLGVLYVIDSITRQWIEKAGTLPGADLIAGSAADGTYKAGVQKIANLAPLLMSDLIASAPYDQKDKISKLVDIWERGNTFPSAILSDFKEKLDERKPDLVEPAFPVDLTNSQSNTPQLSNTEMPNPAQVPAAPADHGAATSGEPDPLNGSSNLAAQIGSLQNAASTTTPSQTLNNLVSQQSQASVSPDQLASLQSVIPSHIASDPVALQKHLGILQQLVQMGVPKDHWLTITGLMEANNETTPQLPAMPRERSRSPPRQSYGSAAYRRRSPNRDNSPPMQHDKMPFDEPKRAKWLDFDPNVPNGSIKVLSRTLFVGGTTLGEDELRDIFKQFGQVQTCIPNQEKRHAFIKYCYRDGALRAKEGMANITDPGMLSRVRSVRWGVGFGPRDCNDYSTGISIIPIQRLTEADRKWVLTAPYGGTGGEDIKTGLVMEEPDIEIGAGVSSKAISRRLGDHETSTRRHSGPRPTEYKPTRRHEREHPQPHQAYPPPPAAYGPPMMAPQRYDPSMHPTVPGFGFSYHPGGGMPPYG